MFNPLTIDNLAESIASRLLSSDATPLGALPRFKGPGLYAIYYTGEHMPVPAYADLASVNAPGELRHPIYVGKAILEGGRKGDSDETPETSTAIRKRLVGHARSIKAAENLSIDDFLARWIVVDPFWIGLGESALIARFSPLWNLWVAGFGNNTPGGGRELGERSRWDTLHPGRPGAARVAERVETPEQIEQDVRELLRSRQVGR